MSVTEPADASSPEPDRPRAPSPGEAPAPEAPLTLADIDRCTIELLGKQGPFRASVRLLRVGRRKFVAKDYRACTALYRWTIGRWNIAREARALERLAGLPGIPRIAGRVGQWVLVMTWFRGKDLGKTPRELQTPEFFDQLLAIVQAMHARGVVHLDLRQRRNVLLQPGGEPAVLDFGAALCGTPGGRMVRWLGSIDVSGVLKYKQRAQAGSLTESEEATLARADRRRHWWPFG